MSPIRNYVGSFILVALLFVQCQNHSTDMAQQPSEEITTTKEATKVISEASSSEAIAATKEAVADATETGTAKLTSIKNEVTEKASTAVEESKKKITEAKKKVEVKPKKKATAKPKSKPKPKPKKRAKIAFEETVHKYGTIKQGDVVKHDFKFTNKGKAPLVIKSVDASCGCTFPSYPFIPIEPGKEGTIGVTFNSAGKIGPQKPTITVVTNGRPRTLKLNLDGYVE